MKLSAIWSDRLSGLSLTLPCDNRVIWIWWINRCTERSVCCYLLFSFFNPTASQPRVEGQFKMTDSANVHCIGEGVNRWPPTDRPSRPVPPIVGLFFAIFSTFYSSTLVGSTLIFVPLRLTNHDVGPNHHNFLAYQWTNDHFCDWAWLWACD